MSQENVEIVRRVAEAWQRDDFEGFLCLLDPEIEWLTAIERGLGSAGNVFHGHEGVRELWNLWRTEFEDVWIETGEVRDLGGERVLRLAHIRFRGPHCAGYEPVDDHELDFGDSADIIALVDALPWTAGDRAARGRGWRTSATPPAPRL